MCIAALSTAYSDSGENEMATTIKKKSIRRFITGLDGKTLRPMLSADADENAELQFRAVLITYDIPAPHILGIPAKCTKDGGMGEADCSRCKQPCSQKLKSMRNALNYWLRDNCMRVSDSEYMVPQTDPEEAQRIRNSFYDRFRDPYGALYRRWGLSHVMSAYASVFDAVGMVTKAAQVLMDLFHNVESTLGSVERAIRFHKNSISAATFETNKFTFDPKDEGTEKAVSIHSTRVRQWYKKLTSYEEVLGDFLTEDTAQSANLGSVNDVEVIMSTCQDRIQVAAQLAGINLE